MPFAPNFSMTSPDPAYYVEYTKKESLRVSQGRIPHSLRSGDLYPSNTDLLYDAKVLKTKNYIETAKKSESLSPKTTQIALNILSEAQQKHLPLPDASYNEEGLFLFVWQREDHYLEMEIDTEQKVYFFYQDKRTLSMAGVDYTPGSPIPCEVLKAWRLFEE